MRNFFLGPGNVNFGPVHRSELIAPPAVAGSSLICTSVVPHSVVVQRAWPWLEQVLSRCNLRVAARHDLFLTAVLPARPSRTRPCPTRHQQCRRAFPSKWMPRETLSRCAPSLALCI